MRRLVVSLALAAFFLLALPATASHWLGVKWRGNPPIMVSVDSSQIVYPEIQQAIALAEEAWSSSSVVDMVPSTNKNAKVTVVMDTYCSLACSPYTKRQGHFTSVTIHLHESLLNYPELQRVVACHELGHALGLSHTQDTSSCMYPTVGAAETPNAHDFEELELIYEG